MYQNSMLSKEVEHLIRQNEPTLERTFRGHKNCVVSLAYRPSLTQLASSSTDGR